MKNDENSGIVLLLPAGVVAFASVRIVHGDAYVAAVWFELPVPPDVATHWEAIQIAGELSAAGDDPTIIH